MISGAWYPGVPTRPHTTLPFHHMTVHLWFLVPGILEFLQGLIQPYLIIIWLSIYDFWCLVSWSSYKAYCSSWWTKSRYTIIWQLHINRRVQIKGENQNIVRFQISIYNSLLVKVPKTTSNLKKIVSFFLNKLVLLRVQLTKIYPPLPTFVQPISITKTLLIVPTKNERDPPLFTGKLLIKF